MSSAPFSPSASESGFTLLELILSFTLLAMVVGISVGSVRMAVTAQKIGNEKTTLYQRQRFILGQLSSKIRSAYPLFVSPTSSEVFSKLDKTKKVNTPKLLLFEGREDSLRFITTGNPLQSTEDQPGSLHELHIYYGEHPDTEETGIIMVERRLSFTGFAEDRASLKDTDSTLYLLAKDVSYLKFRYYTMSIQDGLTEEKLKTTEKNFLSQWVTQIISKPIDFAKTNLYNKSTDKDKAPGKSSTVSIPRAIEVSIGLKDPLVREDEADSDNTIDLPKMTLAFHSGQIFERFPALNTNDEKKTP